MSIKLRRLVGAALLVAGLVLGWETLRWLLLYTGRGAPMGAALSDIVFVLPAIRALVAALGGLLALLALRGGTFLVFLSALSNAVLLAGLLASQADSSLWIDEAVAMAGLAVGLVILAVTPRRRS